MVIAQIAKAIKKGGGGAQSFYPLLRRGSQRKEKGKMLRRCHTVIVRNGFSWMIVLGK